MSKYSEKLKNPRWQKKRLEIFQRDNFTCQFCGATERTLAVHHLEYVRGCEPWEYPDEYLMTICECCHNEEREFRSENERELLSQLAIHKFSWMDLYYLIMDVDKLKIVAQENEREEFARMDKTITHGGESNEVV